nr:hypothetical protein BaRGS_015504 [Batillaria attramentaria]
MGQYPQSFSWNPCYPFDENRCAGVAGCQVVAWPRNYFSLGTQDSAEFVTAPDGHRLQIKYQADQPDPRTGVKR